MNKKLMIIILFVLVTAGLFYMGCSRNNNAENVIPAEEYSANNSRELTTQYCLDCHEGSYQAFADFTAEFLGEDNWLNPHRSAHGTNIPCRTCHYEDPEGLQQTRCEDTTVMIAATCANFCHEQDTLTNPYPNYKSSGPLARTDS